MITGPLGVVALQDSAYDDCPGSTARSLSGDKGIHVGSRTTNGDGETSVPATHATSTGDWLYPVFEGTGRRFGGANATGRPARYSEYRRGLLTRKISAGEGPLESGFRSMRPGDTLWLYADKGVGVVGRATVQRLTGRPEPHVDFTLDPAPSRILAQDPVSDRLVRRALPGVIDGPVPLFDHTDLLESFDWWLHELDDRDERRLEPLGVPSMRPVLQNRPSLLDEPSLAALVRVLRSQDLDLGVLSTRETGPVIVGRGDAQLVVGGLVIGGSATMPVQALRAAGVLAWSAWSLAQRVPGLDLEPIVWFAYRKAPSADVVRFLEYQGHSVSWLQNGQIEFGPRTRLRWQSRQGDAAGLFARRA